MYTSWMKKYLYAAALGISLTAIGIGGYLLYAQNKHLEARVSMLEKKVEELGIQPSEPEQDKKKEKQNIYQKLQSLDNKVGEWIKKQ